MEIIKVENKTFNLLHAVVWSVLVHFLFVNFLPVISSLNSVKPKKKIEKVRLDIIEKKVPLEKPKIETKKYIVKKEILRKPIKATKRAHNITSSKAKPISIRPVQKSPLAARAIKRAPRDFVSFKPIPIITKKKTRSVIDSKPSKQLHLVASSNILKKTVKASPIAIKKEVSSDYIASPYASKMVSPKNFSTKVLHDLKPKKLIQNTKSSSALSRGIARMHSSERVLMSAFSPTPYPVKSIDVESEMENSLNKEELDGIWRQYTNSIQVKIGKAKKYPRLAKKRKQQGKTLLSFKLNRDGKVLDLKIESSSGYEILDQAALKAIKEGEPYPNIPKTLNKKYAYLKIPISFVLKRGKL